MKNNHYICKNTYKSLSKDWGINSNKFEIFGMSINKKDLLKLLVFLIFF